MDQILQSAKRKQIHYVPGEHDTSSDAGKQYLERFGKGTKGRGWYSFDHKGIHFVGLANVQATRLSESSAQTRSNGSRRTSIRVPAAHQSSRFGSVTVLNGHIHQVMQKVEGNVTFQTAMSTTFPRPAPGSAPAAGPMKVPGDRLRSVLGITDVHYIAKKRSLAVVDSPLADAAPAASGLQCQF